MDSECARPRRCLWDMGRNNVPMVVKSDYGRRKRLLNARAAREDRFRNRRKCLHKDAESLSDELELVVGQ